MIDVEFSGRALLDVDRLVDFLMQADPTVALATATILFEAINVLKHSPEIGRTTKSVFRELIVSRGRTGYVVLYRYVSEQSRVLIVAIRHQREVGYK